MKYRVLDGLDLDNVAHAAGDTVEIADDVLAAELLGAEVIAPHTGTGTGAGGAGKDTEGEGGADPSDGGADSDPSDGAGDDGGDAADARAARLIAAIGELVADKPPERQENLTYWTQSGKPKTEALEALSGLEEVSAAERDAAFAAHLAGAEGNGGT